MQDKQGVRYLTIGRLDACNLAAAVTRSTQSGTYSMHCNNHRISMHAVCCWELSFDDSYSELQQHALDAHLQCDP